MVDTWFGVGDGPWTSGVELDLVHGSVWGSKRDGEIKGMVRLSIRGFHLRRRRSLYLMREHGMFMPCIF